MAVSTNYFTFIIVVIFWHRTCAHHCLIHETCSLKIGVLLTAVLPDAVRVPCLVRLLKVRQALKSVVCGWNWGHWSRFVQGKSRSFHLHFLPWVMGLIVAVYNFACFPWHLWTYVIIDIIHCIRYTSLQLPGNYLMLSYAFRKWIQTWRMLRFRNRRNRLRTAWGDRRRRRSKSRSSTGPRHGANTDWEAVEGYPTIHKSAQSANFDFDILSHTLNHLDLDDPWGWELG